MVCCTASFQIEVKGKGETGKSVVSAVTDLERVVSSRDLLVARFMSVVIH